jgi:hypothetical protein
MEKTKAREQLDIYIDICLDCDGMQKEGVRTCEFCDILSKIIPIVSEIREERGKSV